MRPISLNHLIVAKRSLPEALCNDVVSSWGVHPKPAEFAALSSFIDEIDKLDFVDGNILFKLLDGCYFGFTIPQISKEFDCLWIGDRMIINVELKSGAKPEEDIKKQLFRNRYYLRPLKKAIQSFTYVSSTRICYQLDEEGKGLSKVSIIEVAQALYSIHKTQLFSGEIESLFHPEEYLVSPFNSTEAFLRGEYFLTSQQEEIKKKIISSVNNPAGPSILAITGGPGSGKTLLLYDIARALMESGKRLVIGHGGGLNSGHVILNANGWDVRPTNKLFEISFAFTRMDADVVPIGEADVYIMDESQRSPDVDWVIQEVNKKGKKCIFACDANQCLNEKEIRRNNEEKIVDLSGPNGLFRLTSSIRTNESVYEFIKALFNLNEAVHKHSDNSIEVTFCSNITQVKCTLEMLKERGYKVPKFTPNASDFHPRNDYEDWFLPTGLSAHEVIGQEFDAVVGLISPNMHYGPDGKLVSRNNYYYIEDRMLYQILSRARKKIHLVVFNNQPLLNRCLDLLK